MQKLAIDWWIHKSIQQTVNELSSIVDEGSMPDANLSLVPTRAYGMEMLRYSTFDIKLHPQLVRETVMVKYSKLLKNLFLQTQAQKISLYYM